MDRLDLLKWISERHCKRVFLPKPVDAKVIESIILAAGQAASSKNTQPWQVIGLSGDKRDHLSEQLCELFDQNIQEQPDYQYMVSPMPSAFLDRARDCGYGLFNVKGIKRKDIEKRRAHNRENVTFFQAPLVLFFFLPENAERGNFLDLGLFMQNIMLGLVAHGLGSCPQASLLAYTKTIKAYLGIPENHTFVCGLSVGVPDETHPVNHYVPTRLELGDYFEWKTD